MPGQAKPKHLSHFKFLVIFSDAENEAKILMIDILLEITNDVWITINILRLAVNVIKMEQFDSVIHTCAQKDTDRMANHEKHKESVRSGVSLFVQACLCQILNFTVP